MWNYVFLAILLYLSFFFLSSFLQMKKDGQLSAVVLPALGSIASFMGIFLLQVYFLGAGHAPYSARSWTDQLATGAAYTVYGHANDQKEDVLLVRKDGTSNFYAVRVKAGSVPQHFTLVGDRPVAIASN